MILKRALAYINVGTVMLCLGGLIYFQDGFIKVIMALLALANAYLGYAGYKESEVETK